MLRISQFDWKWMLPSMMNKSSIAWMISVNGLIVDVRFLPRSIQEEAYRKGIIPYVPGDVEPGE
jgi:hypothetical protein